MTSAVGSVAGSEVAVGGAPPRSFGEAIATCLSKYATFSGRASRSEYWYFQLFFFLVAFAAGVLFGDPGMGLVALALVLPVWASGARRLHDTNRSGWWQLLTIIPVAGLLVLYWLCLKPVEPNDYGR